MSDDGLYRSLYIAITECQTEEELETVGQLIRAKQTQMSPEQTAELRSRYGEQRATIRSAPVEAAASSDIPI